MYVRHNLPVLYLYSHLSSHELREENSTRPYLTSLTDPAGWGFLHFSHRPHTHFKYTQFAFSECWIPALFAPLVVWGEGKSFSGEEGSWGPFLESLLATSWLRARCWHNVVWCCSRESAASLGEVAFSQPGSVWIIWRITHTPIPCFLLVISKCTPTPSGSLHFARWSQHSSCFSETCSLFICWS